MRLNRVASVLNSVEAGVNPWFCLVLAWNSPWCEVNRDWFLIYSGYLFADSRLGQVQSWNMRLFCGAFLLNHVKFLFQYVLLVSLFGLLSRSILNHWGWLSPLILLIEPFWFRQESFTPRTFLWFLLSLQEMLISDRYIAITLRELTKIGFKSFHFLIFWQKRSLPAQLLMGFVETLYRLRQSRPLLYLSKFTIQISSSIILLCCESLAHKITWIDL